MTAVVSSAPLRGIATWLLGFAAAVAPLEADVVMTLRTTDYSSPVPAVEDTRMAVRPPGGQTKHGPGGGQTQDAGLLRIDVKSPRGGSGEAAARNHTLVFRGGESSSITVVDHRQRSFSVIDRESMAAFGAELRMMVQATAMRVESMPPEQQAIVRKMLENQLGPNQSRDRPAPGTMVRTSERATLSGLPCIKHAVFQGGKKLREVWVALPAAVRGGEPALTLLREMSDFYGTLMGSFEAIAPGFSGGFGPGQNPFEDLARMNGFPVLTRNFAGGRVNTEITLLSVEEQQLSPEEFEPPEGYSPAVEGAPEPAKR